RIHAEKGSGSAATHALGKLLRTGQHQSQRERTVSRCRSRSIPDDPRVMPFVLVESFAALLAPGRAVRAELSCTGPAARQRLDGSAALGGGGVRALPQLRLHLAG